MILGYNTNGLAVGNAMAAINALAAIGYRSVALSLDTRLLNPFARDFATELVATSTTLARHGMRSVVETGARFLLDPQVKHEPTLVSADSEGRARRVDFLKRAIDAAVVLGADCVSLWSGVVRDGADDAAAWSRLIAGLEETLDHAAKRNVTIGFEPEPDMFIDTMARYAELRDRLPAEHLKLTLDVGHLHCLGEVPLADQIARWASLIVNIHIEDMRAGKHEHLMFGDGEIDFPPVIAALAHAGYHGGVNVELSRHSHEGLDAARRAWDFLSPLVGA